MSKWPLVPLFQILTQRVEEHTIADGTQERFVTVRLHGKGAVRREISEGKTPGMRSGYRLVGGDLVYSRIDARNGAFAIVPPELTGAVVSKDFPCFEIRRDRVHATLLIRYLGSRMFYEQLQASSFGTTNRQRISEQALLAYEMPLPPLAKQDRIVQLLEEAEALCRLRAQADGRTETMNAAVFSEVLAGASAASYVSLEELLARIDSGWSPVCDDQEAGVDEWGVLKLGSVTSGNYLDREHKALRDVDAPRPNLEVKAGDVLFTRKNTRELVAATAYVWETRGRLMLSDLMFRLVPADTERLNPVYLTYALKDSRKRQEIQSLASGAAGSMPNIAKSRLLAVKIPVVASSAQRQFAARVAEVRQLESAQAASRQRLEDLRESLLHRAFQGEL